MIFPTLDRSVQRSHCRRRTGVVPTIGDVHRVDLVGHYKCTENELGRISLSASSEQIKLEKNGFNGFHLVFQVMCSDFYQVISVSMRHLTISVQVHFLNTCSARRALRGGRLWLPKWFRRVTGKGYTTRWSTRGCPTPKIPVISLANNWGSKNYHITISPQRICT